MKVIVNERYDKKLGVVKLDYVGLPREGKVEVTCRCPMCGNETKFITNR